MFAQGFNFGTIIIVITIAKIHFEVESRLKVKPFFEHWITVSKGISKVVKYSGLGGLDSFFGFLFGFLKGYIVSVILFSLINWLYPYEKWPMKVEKSFTFSYVNNGSNFLIEVFPNKENYIDTKEKIENI